MGTRPSVNPPPPPTPPPRNLAETTDPPPFPVRSQLVRLALRSFRQRVSKASDPRCVFSASLITLGAIIIIVLERLPTLQTRKQIISDFSLWYLHLQVPIFFLLQRRRLLSRDVNEVRRKGRRRKNLHWAQNVGVAQDLSSNLPSG